MAATPYKMILVFQEISGMQKVYGGFKTFVYNGDDVPGNFMTQEANSEKVMKIPDDPKIQDEKWQLIDVIFTSSPTETKFVQVYKGGETTPVFIIPGANTPVTVLRQFQMIELYYNPNADLSFKQV